MRRLSFASIVVTVFLTSLLTSWFWALMTMVVLTLGIGYWINWTGLGRNPLPVREGRARIISRVLSPVLRTNNRWWLSMVALTLVSFLLASTTSAGDYGVRSIANDSSRQPTLRKMAETQQKYLNLSRYGTYQTHTERGEASVPVHELRSWHAWRIRWFTSLILLALTFVYTFFAFSDEVASVYHRWDRRFREEAGGTTERPWWFRALEPIGRHYPAPMPSRTTTPPTTTTAPEGSGTRQIFWGNFLAELAARVMSGRLFPHRDR